MYSLLPNDDVDCYTYTSFSQSMYPDIPPIWFSDSEDAEIIALIEKCNSLTAPNHLLLQMTKMMALELYKLKGIQPPDHIWKLSLQPTEVDGLQCLSLLCYCIHEPFSFQRRFPPRNISEIT